MQNIHLITSYQSVRSEFILQDQLLVVREKVWEPKLWPRIQLDKKFDNHDELRLKEICPHSNKPVVIHDNNTE